MNKDINHRKRNYKTVIFNEAIEYFEKYSEIKPNSNQDTDRSYDVLKSSILLREEMLSELDHLKELINNNPDLKFEALDEEEKEIYYRFVKFYSNCPICGTTNHYSHLKKIYFIEENKEFKQKLVNLMNLEKKKLKKFNINIGVPCCTCFKKHFEKK